MFMRPAPQEHKRAETDASYGTHRTEVKDDNPGVSLQSHGFAQLVCGFALHKSALALNDRQFANILNCYI
jgi:hypothetical protein